MTRKEIESLFKTHYTQMYHLALTLLFDEAESKEQDDDANRQCKSFPLGMRTPSLHECVAAQAGA